MALDRRQNEGLHAWQLDIQKIIVFVTYL